MYAIIRDGSRSHRAEEGAVVIRLPACIGISPTATRGTTYNTTPLLPLARFRAATWGR